MTRIAFAGDRQIAVDILGYLQDRGDQPLALLLSDKKKASHAVQLRGMCKHLPATHISYGKDFHAPEFIERLHSLDLDFIVGIHHPVLYPKEVLDTPRQGCLNLHPAYLPFNKGWHTPSWAILDGTPYGATLHFMGEEIDSGDIVHQLQVEVKPDDTANSLYQRILAAEGEVFKEAWPMLASGQYKRRPQGDGGTAHKKADLKTRQALDLSVQRPVGEVLDQLRALTTNRVAEAAYFEKDGRRYAVQVNIQPLD